MIDDDGFVTVLVVMRASDYRRLASWCARTELTAELRDIVGTLNARVGWTDEQIKLGSILSSAIDVIEPKGPQ